MLLANFNGKEHLRHRAVSLRQHGFLVIFTLSSNSRLRKKLSSTKCKTIVIPWAAVCRKTFPQQTELNRCTTTETRYKKLISRSPPDNAEIL